MLIIWANFIDLSDRFVCVCQSAAARDAELGPDVVDVVLDQGNRRAVPSGSRIIALT
jgi:hypothetical protein